MICIYIEGIIDSRLKWFYDTCSLVWFKIEISLVVKDAKSTCFLNQDRFFSWNQPVQSQTATVSCSQVHIGDPEGILTFWKL
mgnify:FL=1